MKKVVMLFGLVLLACGAVIFLPQMQRLIVVFFQALDGSTRLLIKLTIVAVLSILVASLLSPLEALGWWAGWYGDSVETSLSSVTLQTPATSNQAISRYVIYLDGIGQADFTYLPEGEEFLDTLANALPSDIAIIRGIMPYSVLNRSLTSDRPFAWFWRFADQMRVKNPSNLLGMFINLRNMMTVAVSADLRYGPIYNRGMAQLMYNSLINYGYQPNSGVPITLIGFSGGGQISMGSAPLLKDALNAPIDVISLGGVFCGRNNSLKLEHIYHLAGEKDNVQRLGAILFPRRWKVFFLSYWNRAKQHGQVSLLSLGAIGHQIPGGVMDPQAFLPDGRSYLEQTVDWVSGILQGTLPPPETLPVAQTSNYERYQAGAFNHYDYYPIQPSPPSSRYRAIAPWMGRLILPSYEERRTVKGVWFEVHHTAVGYEHLAGKVVKLRWKDAPALIARNQSVTRDVYFSDDARFSLRKGVIHPERLNGWRLVDPLESLAGARPLDDMQVMLTGDILLEEHASQVESLTTNTAPTLYITETPTQISGQYYALVQFIQPLENTPEGQRYQVAHFNRTTRQFDGDEETILLPNVIPDDNEIAASSTKDLERSPCNSRGWYIYGAVNQDGKFVVRAIAPRALFQLQPDREIVGSIAAMKYLKHESWDQLETKKGTVSSTFMKARESSPGVAEWTEGTRALLVHNYGGIGGKKREPAAQGPVYFGHFSYGIAQVVQEPLADELQFSIVYHQIYAHNDNGLLSCRHHWSSYMGDRQWGFLGIRPICDVLIKLDSFTGHYDVDGQQQSPLDRVVEQLDLMMARYRIGDGTGATYVGPANNCAQDSNQALYAALRSMVVSYQSASHHSYEKLSNVRVSKRERYSTSHRDSKVLQWMQAHPEAANQLRQLESLGYSLKRNLLPLGIARADWKEHQEQLGSSMEDSPLKQLLTGLASWRTMLPRVASEAIAQSFIRQGASVWVLRTNQVGGSDPDIEPIAPMRL